MKKILSYSLIIFIAIISSAFFIGGSEEEKDAKNLNLFSAVFKMLKNEFVDTLDSDFLILLLNFASFLVEFSDFVLECFRKKIETV